MNKHNISMALSARYQCLANEVFRRLPSGWQPNAIVRLEESRESQCLAQERPAVAYAARIQYRSEDMWIVTLYTPTLDDLSNEAARWILARELSRVLPEPNRSWWRKGSTTSTQDQTAEALALAWGFSKEHQRFEKEYLLQRAS